MRRAVIEAFGVGVAWLLLAASSTAQQGGTGGLGTGGLGTGGLGTGTGTGGLGTGTGSAGNTGGLTGGTGGGSSPFQLQQILQAPTIAPPTSTSNNALSSSNFLSPYYNNVLYQGSAINNQSGTSGGNPGGFGQPTFGTSGGAGGGSIGFAGSAGGSSRGGMMGSSRGGMTGSSRGGALGGTFGNMGGGLGGLGSTNLQSGVVIPHQTPNTYTMVAAFPNRPIPAPALQQQVQSLLARTTAVSNPGTVEAIVSGEIVILRGTVADEEEARRLANMISLTPGVRQVRNEITVSRLPVLDR